MNATPWRSLVRLASGAALISVSTFYLLSSIPFTSYHVLQAARFAWLPVFIWLHPLVVLVALGALLATANDGSAQSKRRIRPAAIAGVTTVACMTALVLVPAALSYELAAAMSFVPLALLIWASGIDIAAQRRHASGPGCVRRRNAVTATAVLAATLASASYLLHAWFDGAAERMSATDVAFVGVLSVGSHVALFASAGLVAVAIRLIAVKRCWSQATERVVMGAAAAVLLAVLIRRSALTTLMLSDVRAVGLAAALGLAIVLCWQSAIEPSAARSGARWALAAAAALVIGLCVVVLPRLLPFADRGSPLQATLVLTAWTASFALAASLDERRWRWRALGAAACAVVLGLGGVTIVAARPPVADADATRTSDLSLVAERYATFDTSFAALLDVFRPRVTDRQFYDQLRSAGDATDDRSLTMVPLRLVDRMSGPPANHPHIFIVVVDSLRPDYLSAYNPAVTFTPAIGEFAAESIVMRQAFTPYAGTALSEAALWAGGLIPRAQYPKPFSAVNNLERLLGVAGYRRYISADEILSATLSDWRNVVRLDESVTNPAVRDQAFKYDLCTTVEELSARLDHDAVDTPVFFYTQPESVHIRVLVDDKYPKPRADTSGFFEPAVKAIRHVDGCFGRLIRDLKHRGIYDDSIVVLTSDHGDSYGEDGRWGHAFYLEPETMRIPLIIRLPERLREGRRWDTKDVALLTDLTPTLYDLLGYAPGSLNPLLGRSMITMASTERPPARDVLLLQSSYSRVFGLLDGHGRWMYKADAIHINEELYEFTDHHAKTRSLALGDRLKYRKWVLQRVRELDRYYGRPQG